MAGAGSGAGGQTPTYTSEKLAQIVAAGYTPEQFAALERQQAAYNAPAQSGPVINVTGPNIGALGAVSQNALNSLNQQYGQYTDAYNGYLNSYNQSAQNYLNAQLSAAATAAQAFAQSPGYLQGGISKGGLSRYTTPAGQQQPMTVGQVDAQWADFYEQEANRHQEAGRFQQALNDRSLAQTLRNQSTQYPGSAAYGYDARTPVYDPYLPSNYSPNYIGVRPLSGGVLSPAPVQQTSAPQPVYGPPTTLATNATLYNGGVNMGPQTGTLGPYASWNASGAVLGIGTPYVPQSTTPTWSSPYNTYGGVPSPYAPTMDPSVGSPGDYLHQTDVGGWVSAWPTSRAGRVENDVGQYR